MKHEEMANWQNLSSVFEVEECQWLPPNMEWQAARIIQEISILEGNLYIKNHSTTFILNIEKYIKLILYNQF